ncbi:CLUMA_CG017384, isoform A [Clunio marinus]|uniref:CLUMA_CG017384, isoform A n=1 Tax=Clunio marinus TaxID=568069 RepID=A0A1J1IYQ2_9DIPT|nr:CLUMA_CG017384, isoform A [Clunio marinus]
MKTFVLMFHSSFDNTTNNSSQKMFVRESLFKQKPDIKSHPFHILLIFINLVIDHFIDIKYLH